ncbi:hypothetical protein PIROE2DRAFT_10712 [Piromyces sp. E2]|nr:hypothetical protein PIROE2DRAFT_10712 [Piromyces sp. E2]|eukprot:OUM62904.1 hypothetical protein PIROE2DRAFT_10712 [Piromyces sp. E2]
MQNTECQIYNKLKGIPLNTNCCKQKCTQQKVDDKELTVCNNNNQVICLDLSYSSLTNVPAEIGDLINLEHL